MDKIVIVTNRPEPDRGLVASLNTLFPECKVQIVFKDVGTFEKRSAGCIHTGDHDQRSA